MLNSQYGGSTTSPKSLPVLYWTGVVPTKYDCLSKTPRGGIPKQSTKLTKPLTTGHSIQTILAPTSTCFGARNPHVLLTITAVSYLLATNQTIAATTIRNRPCTTDNVLAATPVPLDTNYLWTVGHKTRNETWPDAQTEKPKSAQRKTQHKKRMTNDNSTE